MTLCVPKAELAAELRENMIKQLGVVPEPVEVQWNNPKLAEANQEFSAKVGAWDAADASLKTFAHTAVAAQVGCSWCLDINYFHALNQNLDLTKASQVPRWRQSDVFTPLERDVLEYAEAMTNTPPTVTNELYTGLLGRLGTTWSSRLLRRHRRSEAYGSREEVVRPQRTKEGKGSTHSFPLLTYSAPGGLRQGPGRAAESPTEARDEARNVRKWGVTTCGCCCRRMGRAGTSNRRRSDCHRWTTSATMSSPTSRGWPLTRSWARGRN